MSYRLNSGSKEYTQALAVVEQASWYERGTIPTKLLYYLHGANNVIQTLREATMPEVLQIVIAGRLHRINRGRIRTTQTLAKANNTCRGALTEQLVWHHRFGVWSIIYSQDVL